MMRKQLNVCMFLVAACSMPAMADPIAYTIDFTSTFEAGEELPTSGSFDYDSTTQEFSDFSVVFGTNLFDFTAAANGGPSQIGTPPCADGTSAAVASFLLLTSCPSTIWTFYDLGSTGTFNFQSVLFSPNSIFIMTAENSAASNLSFSSGDFSVTSSPEPGWYGLALIGACFMERLMAAAGRLSFRHR
jgi:hypothetical protein